MESYSQKKYTCIVYPGIVKNEEKMLATLGGLDNISEICSKPNRRLELRFRPDDVYCRSACGDRKKTVGFLLKVKVKRRKQKKETNGVVTDSSPSENVIYEPVIMGRVETTFHFKSLCDFQYLPMVTKENGEVENIYDKLLPKGFPSFDWFKEPAPVFLPPAAFSRMDSMQLYLYRKDAKDTKEEQTPTNIIGRTRCRRSAHAVFVTFDVPAAPSKPRVSSMKYLELKFLAGEPYAILSKLFEQRPVWSKTALTCETNFNRDQLKYLLPTVAYYFVTGPFRVMWVRMGYDPRKDPSSRIYQTLDYRIPNRGGLSRLIKAKRRTDSILPFKSVSSAQSKTICILKESEGNGTGEYTNSADNEKVKPIYIFERGSKPPARQMFYQYCDIKLPEVEEMFARLPKPAPDAECHRQRGWLPTGFAERVREIITNVIFEDLEEDRNLASIKFEDTTGGNEDEDDFEEDDDDDDEDDEFGEDVPSDAGEENSDEEGDAPDDDTTEKIQSVLNS